MRCYRNMSAALFRSTVTLLILFSGAALREARAQSGPDNYSSLEQQVVQEINLARANPSAYAANLEKLKPYFNGKNYQRPGSPALTTEEGYGAVEEAIRVLRATRPLPPLDISKGMCRGAYELVRDQGPTGATGHKGSDGSFCEQRVTRFGVWRDSIGENLSYGRDDARERVVVWLIDDGVANRGHRNRLLNPGYKVLGVSCGAHSSLGEMCVITFAGGFDERVANIAPVTNKPIQSKQAKQF